ncbi:MAG: hypothetical protein LIO85_09005 [Rikenellaceae bacterium]|nr:hypothetical protein [Rikenellaceae bacterium]
MKNIISVVLLSVLLWACSDKYDDERLKKELDEIEEALTEMERRVAELNTQLEAVTGLAGSRFVSSISVDADGRYVIAYCDRGGEVRTVRLALGDELTDLPVIGVGEDTDGVLYWRQTADNGLTWEWLLDDSGEKIPITGSTPRLSVDENGYWTVNGAVVTDAGGNPVPAQDLTGSLFTGVTVDGGQAVFTLSDGTELRCLMFEALGIEFDCPIYTAVADRSQTIRIGYTVTGTEAEEAIVDYFTAYNLSVTIDSGIRTISVRLDDGAESGNLVVMAYANGNTALKPLFFTYGTAVIEDPDLDPVYGTSGEIILEGEATTFEIKVSANIDYEVFVDKDASSWLVYEDPNTRAMVTASHFFTAGNYNDATGAVRTGTIRFVNRLYDVSTTVTVKQSPSVEEGTGGISTAEDLVAFAAAVTAGASTARWQDESGEVILNNDIDMAGVTSWTPAGSATGSYTAVNPFRGTFNGQGYAIYNMEWSFQLGGTSNYAFGLFGSLSGATVKNLVLGNPDGTDTFTFTGTATATTTAGAIVGYTENSTIENCTNYVNMILSGDDGAGVLFSLGGIAGTMRGGTLGGSSRSLGCTNYGTVATGKITNTGNGATGMNVGGICTFVQNESTSRIDYCTNYGEVSAPTGRGGGLIGTLQAGRLSNSDNRGLVRDDIVGQFSGMREELTYNNKRMGGLVGGANNNTTVIEYCTNYSDVISSLACRTGGFVGHNEAQIIGCVNRGAVIANLYEEGSGARHGPGWACGYSQASSSTYTNVTGCAKGGRVGDYSTYTGNPSGAPEATDDNAFCHNPGAYDPTINN